MAISMQVQEPVICIPLLLFILFVLRQMLGYIETDQSIRAWWNNHRMDMIKSMCSCLLGVVAVFLKILGLSETTFEVTKKESASSSSDDTESSDRDLGRFTFDESPMFVPITTIMMIQLAALSIGFLGTQPGRQEFGVGEVTCSVWLVLCFWPILKGMFAKGSYGLPWSTLFKSSALAFLFVYLCRMYEKLSGSAYSSEEELKMHHFGGIERWLSSIKERSCIFAIIICTSSKFELGADEA